MTSPESTTSNPTRPRLRRLFGLVILVLLLAAIAFWLYPPRRDRLATLDGQQEWSIAEAPPQRQIIWRSADVVPQPPLPKTSQPSMVRPQFSADGLTLYFSLRDPSHDLNIYQSKFQNGDWSPAEAISALNSAADDVGPALAADGSTLYFYSDREGGHGGFDLYRSLYSAEGWGKPVNLGSRINSVADECEPAITPDGKSLYFSSNHSSNMQGRRRPTVPSRQTGRWTSTLRAAVGFNQYNLYRARRQSASSAWEDAKLLIGLNRSDANDGSPCVDPSGSFLYFSSDRPQRQGERKNLDLYRARIRKLGHGDPDNLGEGINTPGHELEPFLGPHPFQI